MSGTPAPLRGDAIPAVLTDALRSVRIGDATLEYCDLGEGPALLLLHGGQCTAADWSNIAPRLASQYRLIVTDHLVHPFNPWHIWQLLDFLGIREMAMIGHSRGGDWVKDIYRLRPSAVRGVGAIDGTGTGEVVLARLMPYERYSPEAAAMYELRREAMLQLRPHHQLDYPSQIAIDTRMNGYRRSRMTQEERAATRPPSTPVGVLDTVPAPEMISDEGHFYKCPILVIQTGRGKMGPEDFSPEWIKANNYGDDVDFHVIKEAGHWIWLEQPELSLSLIEPFLARCFAR